MSDEMKEKSWSARVLLLLFVLSFIVLLKLFAPPVRCQRQVSVAGRTSSYDPLNLGETNSSSSPQTNHLVEEGARIERSHNGLASQQEEAHFRPLSQWWWWPSQEGDINDLYISADTRTEETKHNQLGQPARRLVRRASGARQAKTRAIFDNISIPASPAAARGQPALLSVNNLTIAGEAPPAGSNLQAALEEAEEEPFPVALAQVARPLQLQQQQQPSLPDLAREQQKAAALAQAKQASEAASKLNAELCKDFSIGVQHEDGGTFTSPNYPNPYPTNLICTRLIEAPVGKLIELKFRDLFDIEEAGNDCDNDKIEIRDGRYGYSKVLARYCGNKFPPEVKSTSEGMWLRFISDGSISNNGFKAVYKFANQENIKPNPPFECRFNVTTMPNSSPLANSGLSSGTGNGSSLYINANNTLEAKSGIHSGVIKHSDVPDSLVNYTKNFNVSLECIWNITVMPGWKIYLVFANYELNRPNDCDSNFIEIYEENLTEENQTVKFCGTRTEPQQSKSNVFNIRHHALPSASGSKFEIVYTAFRDKIGEKCELNEFDCDDGTCIHESLKCDGQINCKYRYDENSDPGPCTVPGGEENGFFETEHMVIILIVFLLLVSGMCASIIISCWGKIQERRRRKQEYLMRKSREASMEGQLNRVGQSTGSGSQMHQQQQGHQQTLEHQQQQIYAGSNSLVHQANAKSRLLNQAVAQKQQHQQLLAAARLLPGQEASGPEVALQGNFNSFSNQQQQFLLDQQQQALEENAGSLYGDQQLLNNLEKNNPKESLYGSRSKMINLNGKLEPDPSQQLYSIKQQQSMLASMAQQQQLKQHPVPSLHNTLNKQQMSQLLQQQEVASQQEQMLNFAPSNQGQPKFLYAPEAGRLIRQQQQLLQQPALLPAQQQAQTMPISLAKQFNLAQQQQQQLNYDSEAYEVQRALTLSGGGRLYNQQLAGNLSNSTGCCNLLADCSSAETPLIGDLLQRAHQQQQQRLLLAGSGPAGSVLGGRPYQVRNARLGELRTGSGSGAFAAMPRSISAHQLSERAANLRLSQKQQQLIQQQQQQLFNKSVSDAGQAASRNQSRNAHSMSYPHACSGAGEEQKQLAGQLHGSPALPPPPPPPPNLRNGPTGSVSQQQQVDSRRAAFKVSRFDTSQLTSDTLKDQDLLLAAAANSLQLDEPSSESDAALGHLLASNQQPLQQPLQQQRPTSGLLLKQKNLQQLSHLSECNFIRRQRANLMSRQELITNQPIVCDCGAFERATNNLHQLRQLQLQHHHQQMAAADQLQSSLDEPATTTGCPLQRQGQQLRPESFQLITRGQLQQQHSAGLLMSSNPYNSQQLQQQLAGESGQLGGRQFNRQFQQQHSSELTGEEDDDEDEELDLDDGLEMEDEEDDDDYNLDDEISSDNNNNNAALLANTNQLLAATRASGYRSIIRNQELKDSSENAGPLTSGSGRKLPPLGSSQASISCTCGSQLQLDQLPDSSRNSASTTAHNDRLQLLLQADNLAAASSSSSPVPPGDNNIDNNDEFQRKPSKALDSSQTTNQLAAIDNNNNKTVQNNNLLAAGTGSSSSGNAKNNANRPKDTRNVILQPTYANTNAASGATFDSSSSSLSNNNNNNQAKKTTPGTGVARGSQLGQQQQLQPGRNENCDISPNGEQKEGLNVSCLGPQTGSSSAIINID